MTKLFTLSIECENDAFADDINQELATILGMLTNKVRFGDAGYFGTLRDTNGNRVGNYELSKD